MAALLTCPLMILLDTDHVTLLKYPAGERGARLAQRLNALPAEEVVGVAIVTVEEQMRGWLAAVAKERFARRQVTAYRELANLFDFFAAFALALFDEQAADQDEQPQRRQQRHAERQRRIAAQIAIGGAHHVRW